MRHITIEPMSNIYHDKVLRLIKEASFTHRHLDWHSPVYWLDKKPGFVYLEDNYVNGFISCGEGPKNIAWVHLFSVRSENLIHNAWRSLFEKVLDYYSSWMKIVYAAIPLEKYYEIELGITGFQSDNKIVVFQKNITDLPTVTPSRNSQVVPCLPVDIESIIEVDHSAFSPLWQLTREALIAAYDSSFYCSKVVFQGQIIAYQFSTRRGNSVHLARIAVKPEYQGKGVARSLLDDLILYAGFNQNEEITVNTQSDNAQSIQLYLSKGFEQQPDFFSICTLEKI